MLRNSLIRKLKVSALHKAIIYGDQERVIKLLDAGVPIDSLDGYGDSPLFTALIHKQYAVATLLINRNCNINLRNSFTRPAILAARECEKDIVELLLRRGDLQICRVDLYGRTLLHEVSSKYRWMDIMSLILSNKEVDVNAADQDGETPLICAAKTENKKAAALLIRAGADVNIRDLRKRTALHWAVDLNSPSDRPHDGVVQILMEKQELLLSPQDVDGDTPLHISCRHNWSESREERKKLLCAGADTIVKNNQGKTALDELFEDGFFRGESQLEEIRLFVEKGSFLEMKFISLYINDLKNNLLVDIEFCTRCVVNKFNNESLPALYNSNASFSRILPPVIDLNLGPRDIGDVKETVKFEIQKNGYCNLDKIRPRSLSAFCTLFLITCARQR